MKEAAHIRKKGRDEGSYTRMTNFLPHHITTMARTGRRIAKYSSDEGLW